MSDPLGAPDPNEEMIESEPERDLRNKDRIAPPDVLPIELASRVDRCRVLVSMINGTYHASTHTTIANNPSRYQTPLARSQPLPEHENKQRSSERQLR